MKKNKIFASVVLMFLLVTFPGRVFATTYSFQHNVTVTPSRTVADGKSIAKVKIMPCDLNPDTGQWFSSVWLDWTLTGSGVTITNRVLTGFPEGGLGDPQACRSASVTWDVKSSSAGTKILTVKGMSRGSDFGSSKNISVTFAAKTATTTTTQKTTTTKTPTPTPVKTPPATPPLTELKIGETQYQATNEYRYETGNAVQFSGKTIANGKVALTFNSEPFTDTTTADANGNWTYALTKNLGEGEHTMTYTVTDPVTNLTSTPTQPVAFTLVAAAKTEAPLALTEDVKTDYTWWYLGGAGTIVALASILGIVIWKRKAKKDSEQPRKS